MFDIAKPASEARAVSAVADGVGRAVCALTRAEGARAWERGGRAAHTPSIADGTALRCGRVGSRHFRSPEDSSPGFFVCVATRHRLPTHHFSFLPAFICPSKKMSERSDDHKT